MTIPEPPFPDPYVTNGVQVYGEEYPDPPPPDPVFALPL